MSGAGKKQPSTRRLTRRLTRRRLLVSGGVLLGGGAALWSFGKDPFRRWTAQFVAGMDLPSGISEFAPNFWFEIKPDNTVVLKSPKVEMGQDIFTGFALLAAEELDVRVDSIVVEPGGSHNSAKDIAGTGGSSTTASLYVPLRLVAATLRETLKLSAAKKWGVEVSEVTTEDGYAIAGANRASYANLAMAIEDWQLAEPPELRPASSFRYIGKPQRRIDLEPKVRGDALYAIDAEMPGMVWAMVLESPFIGGTLASLDTAEAEAFAGVQQVLQLDGLVAVVADSKYAAEMGRRRLQAQWDVPHQWQQLEIVELVTVGSGTAVNVQKDGDARAELEADGTIEAEYLTPLGAHAHMEPNGTVAEVTADRAVLITGYQMIDRLQGEVAKALGMSREQVEVQNRFLGGGFGRRFFRHNAIEAALIARAVGKPVHVFADREDEFRNGYCRPNAHHVMRAKLDSDGRLEAMEHLLCTGDMMLDNMPIPGLKQLLGADFISAGHGVSILYEMPHRRAEMWQQSLPFQTGIWRGVGMFTNTFATESFMDELAAAAGVDPLAFRLRHLTSQEPIIQRMRAVLEAVAERSGWASRTDDVGWGIACGEDRKTLAAAVAQVSLEDGKLRVRKITQAIDPGVIIHPEGVRNQVEGATMMGLSAALYEELTVKDGQLQATNFHQYPVATLRDAPEIDVILLEGSEQPSGVGEPPIAPVAPAIANAISDLTGQRIRSLPLLKSLSV